ncbi:hypothetical protein Tco_0723434, partial [Tanacetum coccineum]
TYNKESEEDKEVKRLMKLMRLGRWLGKVPRKVLKSKKLSKKKKQVFESSSSSEDEKPLKNKKKHAKQGNDVKKKMKKTKKPPTPAQIKRDKYLSEFPVLHILPGRLARFVVRAFTCSSYEFKLDKGIIRVTPEKVHEILGVPLGGNSIFNLLEIPLDPFVNLWFKQFHTKPLKDIHISNIAGKLVLAKRVDFMLKFNCLMLFLNVMGTADTMKVIVNLTVL